MAGFLRCVPYSRTNESIGRNRFGKVLVHFKKVALITKENLGRLLIVFRFWTLKSVNRISNSKSAVAGKVSFDR